MAVRMKAKWLNPLPALSSGAGPGQPWCPGVGGLGLCPLLRWAHSRDGGQAQVLRVPSDGAGEGAPRVPILHGDPGLQASPPRKWRRKWGGMGVAGVGWGQSTAPRCQKDNRYDAAPPQTDRASPAS